MGRVIYETLERPSQRFWETKNRKPVIKSAGVVFQDRKTVIDSVFGPIQVEDLSPVVLVTVPVGKKPIEVFNASDRLMQKVTTDNKNHSFLIGPNTGNSLRLKTKNGKTEVILRIEEDTLPPPQESAGVPAKLNPPPSPLRARAAVEIPREH